MGEKAFSPISPTRLRDPWLLVAAGLGTGCARKAPGTWGTLPGIPLAWGLHALPSAVGWGLLVLLALLGILICEVAGRRLGVSDHGGIVYDEIIGYAMAALLLPLNWLNLVLVFAAFRLFDIWKPWPIRWVDRQVPGGAGVMLDDVLAGLYAAAAVALLLWVLPV